MVKTHHKYITIERVRESGGDSKAEQERERVRKLPSGRVNEGPINGQTRDI